MRGDSQTLRDGELVDLVQSGVRAAFDVLVRRYSGLVYVIAYGRLGNREAAEDLTQEVMLRVFLNLDSFDRSRGFSQWIARITHNLACDWQRHRQSRSKMITMVPIDEIGGQIGGQIADQNGEDARQCLEDEDRQQILHRSVMRLPPPLREIVMLRFMAELNNSQIADHLDIHPATVGRQLKKALGLLRMDLAEAFAETAGMRLMPSRLAERTTAMIGAVVNMSPEAESLLAAKLGGLTAASMTAKGGLDAGSAIMEALGAAVKAIGVAILQPILWAVGCLAPLFALGKTVLIGLVGLGLVAGAGYLITQMDFDWSKFAVRANSAEQPAPPTATPRPVVAVAPVQPEYRAPVRQAPAPQAPIRTIAQPQPNRRAGLVVAARRAGVQLTEYRPQGNGAVVAVTWSSSRSDLLGVFLEEAIREGAIRRFDPDTQLQPSMIDRRRIYTGRAMVYF